MQKNEAKKHLQKAPKKTQTHTHTQLQHKSHLGSILAPRCLPNGTPKRLKNEQKNKTKKEQKKERKKRPNMKKKPDPAVNGKRRLKTLFIIENVLVCICSCYLLTGFVVWKSFRRTTQVQCSLSLPLIGRFWPLLGRSWPLLGALGLPFPPPAAL